jgi:hypothetical protein
VSRPTESQVIEALRVWRRHRRNGTMPPIRTLEVIVGAAKAYVRDGTWGLSVTGGREVYPGEPE